jgi:ATP-dependent Lon protease
MGAVQNRGLLDYLVGGKLDALSQHPQVKNLVHCLKPSSKPLNVNVAMVENYDFYQTKNFCHLISNTESQQCKLGHYDILVTKTFDDDSIDAIEMSNVKLVVYSLPEGEFVFQSIEKNVAYLGIPLNTYVFLDCSKPLDTPAAYIEAIQYSPTPIYNRHRPQHVMKSNFDAIVGMGEDIGMSEDEACFQLFDPELLKKKVQRYGKDKLNTFLTSLQEKIPNGKISTCPLPENFHNIMDDLLEKFPNFSQVIDYLRNHLVLEQIRTNPTLNFGVPILLDGPPGIGKSAFFKSLVKKLGTHFEPHPCASASNGFDIKGLSSGYSGGKEGLVCRTLIEGKVSNPIILLDEVEKGKVSSSTGSSVHSVLYELLEPINAKMFKDEFIDLNLDASQIIWFATSNNIDELPAPIKDRFHVIKVQAPNNTELRSIIKNMYREYVETKDFKMDKVSPDLDEQVVSMLATDCYSLRGIKQLLGNGLGRAVQRTSPKQQVVLKACDIPQLEMFNPTGEDLVLQ